MFVTNNTKATNLATDLTTHTKCFGAHHYPCSIKINSVIVIITWKQDEKGRRWRQLVWLLLTDANATGFKNFEINWMVKMLKQWLFRNKRWSWPVPLILVALGAVLSNPYGLCTLMNQANMVDLCQCFCEFHEWFLSNLHNTGSKLCHFAPVSSYAQKSSELTRWVSSED